MLPVNKYNSDIKWKIWYHDTESPTRCRTWSNLDGPAEEAPRYGVIVIVQPVDGGRHKERVSGADYYAIDDEGKWTAMNESGLQDRIKNNIPFSALKEGRWINSDRFQEIMTRAFVDVDFGGTGKFDAVRD